MSYNDDRENRGGNYGDRRRDDDSYGERRHEGRGGGRSDEYDERRQEGRERGDDYGERRHEGGGYGGGRDDNSERRHEGGGYGGGRGDNSERRHEAGGGRDDRRDDYGERRQESGGRDDRHEGRGGYGGGRSDEYGSDRPSGGYSGRDTRHEADSGYDQRRQDIREHAASGYGSGNPTGDLSYGGRRPDDPEYGGGGSQGDNYYDKSKRFDDEPPRRTGESEGRGSRGYGGSGGSGGRQGSGNADEYSIANSGTANAGTPYSAVGGGYGGTSDDYSSAASTASQHAGSAGDSSLFGNALSLLSGKKQSLASENVDEDDAVRQHKQFYGGEDGGQANSGNLGVAAAMQALKLFNGGQSDSGGGNAQNQVIGMAMAQAAELFDKQSAQGNTHPDATKQDAVTSAAQMALKMYMKSEMGGGGAGGTSGADGASGAGNASSGGGLLGFASKFL